MAEVWQRLPADNSNKAMATAKAKVTAGTATTEPLTIGRGDG
jgi:hypothetical protein